MMKKMMSTALAAIMAMSLAVPAFAEDQSTTVTYTGTGTEQYTVTVPASMSPRTVCGSEGGRYMGK